MNPLKSTRFSWSVLGFGFIQLSYIESYKYLIGSPHATFLELDLYWGLAALAAVMLAALSVAPRTNIKRLRSAAIAIALIESILGSVLLIACDVLHSQALFFAWVLLLGTSCSLLWIAWEDKLAMLDTASVFFAVAACALMTATFHIASTLFPDVHVPLIICTQTGAIVLLFQGFSAGSWRTPPRCPEAFSPLEGDSLLSPRSIVTMTFVFAFSYHFAIRTVFSDTNNLIKDAEDVVSALCLLALFLLSVRCSFTKILRMALPLIIASYMLIQILPIEVRPACIALSGAASKLIQLFLVIEIIVMSSSLAERRRFSTLSFGIAAMFFGRLASDVILRLTDSAFPIGQQDVVVVYVLLAILLLSLLLSLTSKPNASTVRTACEQEELDSRQRHEELARQYKLTSREEEVLALLAQGRTRSVIARRLCISDGTAHAHISHIYNKMGVHSQQELLDLLEI